MPDQEFDSHFSAFTSRLAAKVPIVQNVGSLLLRAYNPA
jgi:hypothetical protein